MIRKQAINYLRSSGMSEEQINGVVEALTEVGESGQKNISHTKNVNVTIITLPSVIPARAKGKWEKAIITNHYRCSVCKGEHNDSEKGKWYETFDTCAYNFCPNCGAKMEGVSE